MNILKIGNPILRKKAQIVESAIAAKTVELAQNLIATAQEANGVGIAAPQVAESCRLFIMASRPSIRYPYAPKMSPTAIINPVILNCSDRIIKDWEGCLSVPNIRGLVPRHQEIEVEYTDIEGRQVRGVFTDFVARIFQHELDHLDGILFIDRVLSQQDLYTEEEYQKIVLDR